MDAQYFTPPDGYVSIGEYRQDPLIAETFTPNDIRRLIAMDDIEGIKRNGRYYVKVGAAMPDPNLLSDLPPMCFIPPLTQEEIEIIFETGEETEAQWDDWARRHYRVVRKRAKKKGLEFRLTMDRLVRMVRATSGRCQVTGIPFSESNESKAFRRPWVPSVDRIDCSQGYTPSNCRIVCAAVNQAMGEHGPEALMRIAQAMVSRPPQPH